MKITPKMIDLARPVTDMDGTVMEGEQIYPYGLSICLCQEELDKLDIKPEDIDVGDTIHIFAFAKVNSKSINDTPDGSKCRIEMQITHIGVEDEDKENQEADKEDIYSRASKKMYGK